MTIEKDVERTLRTPMSREQRATLDGRINTAIAAHVVPRRRRIPIRRSLLLAALLAVAVPGLIVGGALVTTNWFEPISVKELRAEIAIAKNLVPLPPNRQWPAHLSVPDGTGTYEAGAGREWVEHNAVCLWLDEWLDARTVNDGAREAKAARTIAPVPTWPSWTSPYWVDGGFVGHLRPLIDAVADGDEGPVRDEMQTNCDWVE